MLQVLPCSSVLIQGLSSHAEVLLITPLFTGVPQLALSWERLFSVPTPLAAHSPAEQSGGGPHHAARTGARRHPLEAAAACAPGGHLSDIAVAT